MPDETFHSSVIPLMMVTFHPVPFAKMERGICQKHKDEEVLSLWWKLGKTGP